MMEKGSLKTDEADWLAVGDVVDDGCFENEWTAEDYSSTRKPQRATKERRFEKEGTSDCSTSERTKAKESGSKE
ncbi:hypothetical protein Dda_0391 [Drechslerella dactyloides]|uniref:Uncharacterized protein n=1 Tax=Drechslerella dactyloides TaxID=74499 RepID=A0AAD6NN11_DREDA|nr:hypothetical protein Dda_0391 [Drechslerella dactyloides]